VQVGEHVHLPLASRHLHDGPHVQCSDFARFVASFCGFFHPPATSVSLLFVPNTSSSSQHEVLRGRGSDEPLPVGDVARSEERFFRTRALALHDRHGRERTSLLVPASEQLAHWTFIPGYLRFTASLTFRCSAEEPFASTRASALRARAAVSIG